MLVLWRYQLAYFKVLCSSIDWKKRRAEALLEMSGAWKSKPWPRPAMISMPIIWARLE